MSNGSMETTFITIHDLTPDAHILYSSDSIIDILGYTPDEVVNRPCWDFFHPEEVPFARKTYDRGVMLDKAASLSYVRLKDRDGRWVCCECVFTIVYDVMVGCISIYRRDFKSLKRAAEAPVIRRLFASSPRDPRYHMLSHLSSKFVRSPKPDMHEPRAALFLNRFTRTLTIMYATNALRDLLGIDSEGLKGRSFYYLIQENCLEDAVKCLENAKANDSIAYLRFWYRDPRQDDEPHSDTFDSQDEEMLDIRSSTEDDDEGGVHLNGHAEEMMEDAQVSNSETEEFDRPAVSTKTINVNGDGRDSMNDESCMGPKINGQSSRDFWLQSHPHPNSRASSGESTSLDTHEDIFGQPETDHSSSSSLPVSPEHTNGSSPASPQSIVDGPVELEAVISSSSDGMVVCMRRARPVIPHPIHAPARPAYPNGVFASPWGTEPIMPPPEQRPQFAHGTGFAPSLGPVQPARRAAAGGPAPGDLMDSIREIAVFAWALAGINGHIADYSTGPGKASGESQPSDGLPLWTGGREPKSHEMGSNYTASQDPERTNSYGGYRPAFEHTNSHNNGVGQHPSAGCSLAGPPSTNGLTAYNQLLPTGTSPQNGSLTQVDDPVDRPGMGMGIDDIVQRLDPIQADAAMTGSTSNGKHSYY